MKLMGVRGRHLLRRNSTEQEALIMGIFDFVKEAGKKIGLGDDAPAATDLKAELDSHKIGADDIKIDVAGDKAVLSGVAASREIVEKAVIAIGNTIGISKVETDVKVPTPIGTAAVNKPSTMYTVKKGDTLWHIAEVVYGKGHGKANKAIFDANQPMLKSPDKIYPGQVLRIPAMEHKAAA
jgi:nucleoid-associated protein YgaU